MRSLPIVCWGLAAAFGLSIGGVSAQGAGHESLSGDYLEMRTCDIYTGPCFANSQVGLAGQEAILAWSIDRGEFQGVDLAGLKVAMAIKAQDTLGFGGGLVIHPDPIKSVVIVDARATIAQREALVEFARTRAGRLAGQTMRIDAAEIEMTVDHIEGSSKLAVGSVMQVETRKMEQADCVCCNETVFYPPLTPVDNSQPAFAIAGGFHGRGLGTHWQAPQTRSAFVATFDVAGE